jgi:multiple sugar transport system ATP-binding protein
MNLIELPVDVNGAKLGSEVIELSPTQRSELQSDRLLVGVRPEGFSISGEPPGLDVIVDVVEELGADAYAFVTTEIDGAAQTLTVRVDPGSVPAKGAKIPLHLRRDKVHLFDAATGSRLPI